MEHSLYLICRVRDIEHLSNIEHGGVGGLPDTIGCGAPPCDRKLRIWQH